MTKRCDICGHRHDDTECPVCGRSVEQRPPEPRPFSLIPVLVLYTLGGGFILFWIVAFAFWRNG